MYIGGSIIFLLVFVLVLLYLRGSFREDVEYKIINVPSVEDTRFPLLLVGLTNAVTTNGQLTGFWVGPDDIYAARLEAIRNAKRTIRFETYYMTPGRRADDFATALIERIQAGVKVQILVDDYGTKAIKDKYWQRLRKAGVQVQFFRKFNWRSPLEYNSRTHRKLLLLDSQQAMLGGAGVSDQWDGDPDISDGLRRSVARGAPWLDMEISYSGEIASILEGQFMQNWAYVGGTVDLGQDLIQPQPESGTTLYIKDSTSQLNESTMRMLFQVSLLAARERIWISSPYFLPDVNTRNILMRARKNGVDVRILTMGRKNDKPLTYFASRELYDKLLQVGVQICEYQPSMNHAKVILIDNHWVSAGSANFDPRSYIHNDELNVSTNIPELINKVDSFFENALINSRYITHLHWKNRSVSERIKGRLGLIFKPLL
ncbi:phospholipase D-like domain-containing protein [Nostoc sp. CCY0012]|uniref:phospholipase D-like domain-containing protein n=1 Tax=Nostoc sp. CCY0012 TaxID=1056123 RepID=UPI0039C6C915